jgi:hypothetical protein
MRETVKARLTVRFEDSQLPLGAESILVRILHLALVSPAVLRLDVADLEGASEGDDGESLVWTCS